MESSAREDIREAAAFIAGDSPHAAIRWMASIQRAMASLAEMPLRCALAPENDVMPYEVRHLVHGSHRILFKAEETAVHILHVRHGARQIVPGD